MPTCSHVWACLANTGSACCCLYTLWWTNSLFGRRVCLVTLTCWNLAVMSAYFLLAALVPHAQLVNRVYNVCFASTVTVVLVFYGVYTYDSSLIVPPGLEHIIPPALNHLQHTLPLPLVVLAPFYRTPSHSRKHEGVALIPVMFVGYLTLLWVISHNTGYCIYAFLKPVCALHLVSNIVLVVGGSILLAILYNCALLVQRTAQPPSDVPAPKKTT